MSLDSLVSTTPPARTVNGKPVAVRPITIRGLMRLAKLVDTIRGDIDLTREQMSQLDLGNGNAVVALVRRIVEACLAKIDLAQPAPTGTPSLVFEEVAHLLGVTPDDILDGDLPGEVYPALLDAWEAIARSPLGASWLGGTIAKWMLLAKDLEEMTYLNTRQALTLGLLAGGTGGGGTIESSFPSTGSSDGPSTTSSTSFPPDASSTSSDPSATSPATNPPSSVPGPESPAEEAAQPATVEAPPLPAAPSYPPLAIG